MARSMVQPGSILELSIEKPAAGGRMIGRLDGRVALVAGTIPGERVKAQVERVRGGVIYAAVTSVLEPSPDRRPAPEDWACGGMLLAHIQYERQLALKSQIVADSLRRIGRIDWTRQIAIVPSPEEGYRLRSRLHVDRRPDRTMLGFYREGSHSLCDPSPTRQLSDSTLGFLHELGERLRAPQASGVAAVEIAENVPGTTRAVHFEVEHSGLVAGLGPLTEGLPALVGVSYGPRDSRTTRTATGQPWVCDTVLGVTLRRHVRAFFQANRFLLERLVCAAIAWLEPGDVLDLYSGVGLFAACIAASSDARRVTAVEGDPISARDLLDNARRLSDRLDARPIAVEDYLDRRPAGPANLVIDPPRVGISNHAIKGIIQLAAPRLIYVSCDVATLSRDLRKLIDAGYELRHVEAFDLFPNTGHVETLAVLHLTAGSRG